MLTQNFVLFLLFDLTLWFYFHTFKLSCILFCVFLGHSALEKMEGNRSSLLVYRNLRFLMSRLSKNTLKKEMPREAQGQLGQMKSRHDLTPFCN